MDDLLIQWYTRSSPHYDGHCQFRQRYSMHGQCHRWMDHCCVRCCSSVQCFAPTPLFMNLSYIDHNLHQCLCVGNACKLSNADLILIVVSGTANCCIIYYTCCALPSLDCLLYAHSMLFIYQLWMYGYNVSTNDHG